ncbi:MAG: hypothetical protein ABSA09_00520 [Desulfobaccales bacterium]|jgi:translation initiation factor 2 alpha subunit (eIF-2alpha)
MVLSPEVKKVVHADKYRMKTQDCDNSLLESVKKCTEIIEAALQEYGCSFQVVMVPQVTVVPKPKP